MNIGLRLPSSPSCQKLGRDINYQNVEPHQMCLYDPWEWMGISEVGTKGADLRDHLRRRYLWVREDADSFSVLN